MDLDGADEWLLEESGGERWVANVDGKVAGHVQLVPLHAYLASRLEVLNHEHSRAADMLEVVKLFVDPLRAGHGIGTALLSRARAAAWAQGKQPILAVLASSGRAIGFYERAGLRLLGSFDGIHGVNFVFVDDSGPPANTPID